MPGAAGINRIISGELAQTKTKGQAFMRQYEKAFSPEGIVKKSPLVKVSKKK